MKFTTLKNLAAVSVLAITSASFADPTYNGLMSGPQIVTIGANAPKAKQATKAAVKGSKLKAAGITIEGSENVTVIAGSSMQGLQANQMAHQQQVFQAQQIDLAAELVPVFGRDINGPLAIYPSSIYAGLRAECGNSVSSLKAAVVDAMSEIKFGGFEAGSRMIYNAIARVAQKTAYMGYGSATPNTSVAARKALGIANLLVQEIDFFKPVMKQNTSAVKFYALKDVADVVVKAFETLDAPYFFDVMEQGRGNHFHQNNYDLYDQYVENDGRDFFNRTTEVAQLFINFYFKTAPSLGHNLLDTMVLGQSANAASEILATSGFRRKNACAALELRRVTRMAQNAVREYLNSPVKSAREEILKSRLEGQLIPRMQWALNSMSCN